MIDEEPTTGFDRRSLIKKGLVGAGIAATVPVISTFNTAAFASSTPGCQGKEYTVSRTGGGAISVSTPATNLTSSTLTCGGNPATVGTCTWTTLVTNNTQVPTANITVSSIDSAQGTVTWTLVGAWSSCEFVSFAAGVDANPDRCDSVNFTLSNAPGGTNNRVTFDVDTINPGSGGNAATVRLMVLC